MQKSHVDQNKLLVWFSKYYQKSHIWLSRGVGSTDDVTADANRRQSTDLFGNVLSYSTSLVLSLDGIWL